MCIAYTEVGRCDSSGMVSKGHGRKLKAALKVFSVVTDIYVLYHVLKTRHVCITFLFATNFFGYKMEIFFPSKTIPKI